MEPPLARMLKEETMAVARDVEVVGETRSELDIESSWEFGWKNQGADCSCFAAILLF